MSRWGELLAHYEQNGVTTSIGTFDYEDEEWVYDFPQGGQLVLTRQTRVFRQFGGSPERVVADFLEWFRVWAAAGAWVTSVVPHLTIQRAGNPGDPWWERL